MKLKKGLCSVIRSIGFIFDHTIPGQERDDEQFEIVQWAVTRQAQVLDQQFAINTLLPVFRDAWNRESPGHNLAIVHHMLTQMD